MTRAGGLVVAGRLVVDEVLHCAQPPLPGTAQRADRREIAGGGQVWHTAGAAAARVPVTVAGWCGADPDTDTLRARLAGLGIADALVVGRTASRAVVLVGPDGERTIVSRPRDPSPAEPVLDEQGLLEGRAWLHLDGYALDDSSGDALVSLAAAAAVLGIPVSLEPPATDRIRRYGSRLERLPPLTALLGRPDEVTAAVALLSRPPRWTVAHDGPRDVVARTGTRQWSVPVPQGPVTALGAGDRFTGGWLAATLRGAAADEALAAGVTAAHSG